MKSKYLAGLIGFGLLSVAVVGCNTTINDGVGGTTGATGVTGVTSATGVTSTGSNKVTSTGTGTGGAGSGNHSFDTATDITVNPTEAPPTATLVDAATADYYKFTGTKGERITAYTSAQSLAAANPPTDATITDTVVTIYDSTKTAIAQNDDMFPGPSRDSQAWTILPADGTYYLKVEDCNSALGADHCAPAADITTFDYTVAVADVSMLGAPEVNTTSNTATTAAAITYAVPSGGTAGDYGEYIIDGSFAAATDTNFYSFTPPADTTVDAAQRAHAEFWLQPISATNGDGSASNVVISIIDAQTLNVVAQADQSNYTDGDQSDNAPLDLSVPVTVGHQYYAKITPKGAVTGATQDFYFLSHFVGSFYYGQLEKDDLANNLAATAETLTTPTMVTAGVYFVDGDITTPGIDVDWYTMTVPSGATTVSIFCDAQRAGSGLRGAKFGVYDSTGVTKLGEYTENAAKSGGLSGTSPNCLAGGCSIALPANTTAITLKVEAASQDSAVTGTFYHCDVDASAP